MSTYYNTYSYNQQEQQRRREEWEQAPKQCPHCWEPINQQFQEYGNNKPRYHCGTDKCRKAASRLNIAERKRQERSAARQRVLNYCNEHLTTDQRKAVMDMCDMLMQFSYEEGHQIALQVVQVIEQQRCKHDRIAQLEEYAAIWKRRAQTTEEQLKARIAELEAELEIFSTLEATIHGIAKAQLKKQPDPQPQIPTEPETEREDPDRARVVAQLSHLGIKPIEEALAEEEGRDDTEEGDEYEGEEE